MKQVFAVAISAIAALLTSSVSVMTAGPQATDPDPDIRVARPAYVKRHPKVLFDEAHFNVHTSGGRSTAFDDLLANDGYRVIPNQEKFQPKKLKAVDILVIVSALGADRETAPEAAGRPAFTEEECDAVEDWVRRGGRLLLIIDHEPTGAAAQNLARRFSVEMSHATRNTAHPRTI